MSTASSVRRSTGKDLQQVYELEMALLPVLARMRLTGVRVDRRGWRRCAKTWPPCREGGGRDIRGGGPEVQHQRSWRRSRTCCTIPKDKGGQGLKPWKLTDGGKERKQKDAEVALTIRDWSTDADVLETFVGNPVVDALLDYQAWYKLLHTYVLGYLGDPTAKDKPCKIFNDRIFADFVQYGTRDGPFLLPGAQPPERRPTGHRAGQADTRGVFIADAGLQARSSPTTARSSW